MKCPKCKLDWPADCEQSISIEFFDECFGCRFTKLYGGSGSGTMEEANRITEERQLRKRDPIVDAFWCQ